MHRSAPKRQPGPKKAAKKAPLSIPSKVYVVLEHFGTDDPWTDPSTLAAYTSLKEANARAVKEMQSYFSDDKAVKHMTTAAKKNRLVSFNSFDLDSDGDNQENPFRFFVTKAPLYTSGNCS